MDEAEADAWCQKLEAASCDCQHQEAELEQLGPK